MEHKNVTHVREDCWKITFLEKSNLRVLYFFCDTNPNDMTLEEILNCPQVGKEGGISFRQALLKIGCAQVPNRFRQQKKALRRITDDANLEEHY